MYWTSRMTKTEVRLITLLMALIMCGCGTFEGGSKSEGLEAEIRQVPGKAEYTVFGTHRLRAYISVTGLPEGATEEDTAAARTGTYAGLVVWSLQGAFTFGTDAHRVLEPKVTVSKSKPEQVEILLTVVPPSEEVAGITITRAPISASITASPQAKFRVVIVEDK